VKQLFLGFRQAWATADVGTGFSLTLLRAVVGRAALERERRSLEARKAVLHSVLALVQRGRIEPKEMN
jgi:hypothetical protein